MGAAGDQVTLRVPRRYRIMVWSGVLAAVALVVGFGVVLASTGVPGAAVVVVVVAILAIPVGLFLPLLFGSGRATLDAAGVRARIFPWDRHPQLVPWTDVTAAWIRPVDRYTYLHLALADPERYLSGGKYRRSVLSGMLDEHGTPFLMYVSNDGTQADAAAVRAAVSRFTGGRVRVTDERPDVDLAQGNHLG
jgi:hypothetical protein